MPASFRLVEPTALYARSGHAAQESLTDVHHDGLVNLIRQLASVERHAADIFLNVSEEILLIDERCGRLTERITELDEATAALPNPIKTKITCAGSISRYTNVKHHFRNSDDVSLKPTTLPERPAHLVAAYRAAGHGRTGPPPIFETAATQTDSGRPTPTDHSDQRSQSTPTPSPTSECSISPPICQIDIVAVDVSGRAFKRAQASRCKWPQSLDIESYTKRHDTTVSSSTSTSRLRERHRRSREKSSESPPPPLSPTDADIYDWHAKDDFDYDYLPFQRKKSGTVLQGVYASLRRPKKRTSDPNERNSSYRSCDHIEDSRRPVDADNSTDSHDDTGAKAKTVLRRSLSLRRVRRQKKPSGEIVYEELPFLLEKDRLLRIPARTDSNASFKELSRRKLSLPISTSSQVIYLATTLMSKESRHRPRDNQVGQPEHSGMRPDSVLSVNSNISLELAARRTPHDGFYRRGYQLDSPDALVVGPSNQSSPRDPVGESPDVRSTADSSYSCDHEGYYTSMHKDSGLVVTGPSGLSVSDRHSGLSAGDPTKPRGDSSGDSGAEDLQDACADDKQRAEMHNTAVTAPTQQAAPIIADTSRKNRPQIIRPKVIDTFDRGDTHRSTLPRQSRQMPTRPKNNEDNTQLDEWLLRKFETEMVVKSRARSASVQRMASTPHDSVQSLPSANDRKQQFAQAMSIRKAVRFCE